MRAVSRIHGVGQSRPTRRHELGVKCQYMPSACHGGFLRGLACEFPDAHFPILTGVSADATNAARIGVECRIFPAATERLVELWRNL
jgi:hypothetical protein